MRRALLLLTLAAPAHGAPPPLADAVRRLADAQEGAVVLVADARSGAVLHEGGAVSQPLPPGSVFKLVAALAAGVEDPARFPRRRLCSPQQPDGPEDATAGKEGHGWISVDDALARSCNRYFSLLGHDLGAARILRTAAALGLTQDPPPPVPPSELALGTGVRLTAHQHVALLRHFATGQLPLGLSPPRDVVARIRQGLCRSVTAGTARSVAWSTRVPVCGKTGTALWNGGFLGWFGGYGPATAPEVVVVIGLPHKVGREAARQAGLLFASYFGQ